MQILHDSISATNPLAELMKISIIIPTRERSQYLRHSLQTALEIDDDQLEIVVSDNASCDGTRDLVQGFDDPRLIYVNTGARVSMRQNFNFAFHASRGDYLIYFGDDDGILPGQFPFLRHLLETHRPDGLCWVKTTYGWPVATSGKRRGGMRFYRDACFVPERPVRGTDNLPRLLAADVGNLPFPPDIYHGCLSRAYMLRTAMNETEIFDSAIPDVNLTYRGILKGGDFIGVGHPFSINGYSPASTGGGHGAAQNNKAETGASDVFAKENRTDDMSDVMPHAGSVPLAFFTTLETLRRNHGLGSVQPDYFRWYHFVLGSARKNPALGLEIRRILQIHAAATGTEDALQAALAAPVKPKRSTRERLARVLRQAHSFKVPTADGAEDTILTAAHTADRILGRNLGPVLSGQTPPRSAWSAAKRRARTRGG